MARNNSAKKVNDISIEDVLEVTNTTTTKETKVKAEKIELSKDDSETLDSLKTVSAKIRFLNGLNYSRGQIADHLGKRYQHVRNVLETPLKKVAVEVSKVEEKEAEDA